MNRRKFLLGSVAAPLLAQSTGKPTNLDEMPRLGNIDKAGEAAKARMTARASSLTGVIQPVVTRSANNFRHGTYLQETVLTPQALSKTPLRKLFSLALVGDKRGIEAQPLFAPRMKLANGSVHDLCVCTTMANQVYVFDANTGATLWMMQLGTPITGTSQIDGWLINDHWGILSTGVIDGTTLYVVTWSSPDGTAAKGRHQLHEISLANGAEIRPAIALDAAGSTQRKQRASLVLTEIDGVKTIFIPWGTIQETAHGAHGYVSAVDVASWRVVTEWNSTPTGSGAGIWMAGQGLAADTQGYLYAITGNGDFDGVKNFGESFVKLHYDGKSIMPVDWWSPFLDSARGGDWDDMDLGSGGVTLIPALQLVLGAGKDGILYVLGWRSMGETTLADLEKSPAANYAKLKTPPQWFTFFPGYSVDAAPANIANLNQLYFNRTHHMHSTPVYWNSAGGPRLYCWGENGNLRVWSVDATGKVTFLANSAEMASAQSPVPPGGMPGGMMCLSAKGGDAGVLWACVPDGDANREVTTGRVYAYDAQAFGKYSDGTGATRLLWSSPTYTYNKFCPPVVNGGKLFVPTYAASVDVYGL